MVLVLGEWRSEQAGVESLGKASITPGAAPVPLSQILQGDIQGVWFFNRAFQLLLVHTRVFGITRVILVPPSSGTC